MWNAGATPARMIEIISPAGFEQFFRDVATVNETGEPLDVPAIAGLAERYGLTLAQPDWLPDVVARYNLNPPPGV